MSFQVKSVITNLEQIAKDTEKESLITDNITKDLFGDPLDKSRPLWTVSDNSRVPIYLREMLTTVCTVLTRQYRTYLELCDEDKEKMAKETGNVFKFISKKNFKGKKLEYIYT